MRAALLFLILTCLRMEAATINAASTSYSDVSNAISQAASSGDTVVIPAGGPTDWTQTLYITNKAIRLTGAGIGQTIIRDAVATDLFMRIWLIQSGQVTEIDNIEFRGNGGLGTDRIWVEGSNTNNARINWHHCKFDQIDSTIFLFNTARGVVHHTLFYGKPGAALLLFHSKDNFYNGVFGVQNFGNSSLATADHFGTDDFIFFEDNFVTNGARCAATDGQGGARYVYRHNTNYNVTAETHGSEAGERTGRAFEIYNNYFHGDGLGSTPVYMRGGVTLCYSNTFTNWSGPSAALSLLDNRVNEALFPPFGGGTGINPWDSNNATLFASGTVSSVSGLTLTDSGKSFTTDQYKHYQLLKTSGQTVSSLTRSGSTATATVTGHGFTNGAWVSFWGANEYGWNHIFVPITVTDANTFTFTAQYSFPTPATGTIKCTVGNRFARIEGNAATTITWHHSIYYPTYPGDMTLLAGDTYEIRKIEQGMDQVGTWGGTDFGTTALPTLENNFAASQTISPCYEWANTNDGGDINWQTAFLGGDFVHIKSGVHYFNDTAKPGYTTYTYPYPLVSGISPSSSTFNATTMNVGTLRFGQ